jgi:hypothetical protein
MFDEAAVNTLDEENAARQSSGSRYAGTGMLRIPVDTLAALTSGLIPEATRVDFMSIDVEGLDLQVLRSNDWSRTRPRMVVVECLGSSIAATNRNPISGFLGNLGYGITAVTGNSYLFKDMESEA